jgi:hypothetical protein
MIASKNGKAKWCFGPQHLWGINVIYESIPFLSAPLKKCGLITAKILNTGV